MSTSPTLVLPTTANGSTSTVTSLPSANTSSTSLLPSSPSPTASPPSGSVTTGLPSSTANSTLSNTASNAAETSVQNASGPGSIITSVIIIQSVSEGINTITTQPTFTLSKVVVSTMTDSYGSKVTMTPPLITISSTLTESNGSLVTATSVVVNPQQDNSASQHGILHNVRAVAGIFSVVGVAFTSLVIGLVFCIRRQRRIRQRKKWLSGTQLRAPSSFIDDPFRDETVPPAMRSTANLQWDQKLGLLTPEDSNYGHQDFGQANNGVVYPLIHDRTFIQQSTHIGSSTEPTKTHSRLSRAPSTPSIYSINLPPEEDEQVSNDIVSNPSQVATTLTSLPPRPPRSHLRGHASAKNLRYNMPTPPESESSNHTTFESP